MPPGVLNSAGVALKEKRNETLNDFPNTTAGKIYELSMVARRQERVISWSSKLKYTSRTEKTFTGGGDVSSDHQEGVWERFAFSLNNEAEGQRLVQAFSHAIDLCNSGKK